ncbi:protein of unknown function [Monaibacterium marinum]|uniref:YjiS-like domain-containing protein n=1 Tax=Pontivivens marinum TaxID=1690039 RepID=A0A2C9CNW1_9RHOB|nr:DUF1127 domain-containing protein [Monaibacterium marinum]SOH92897.1 protein of unknown function [Monaibacterium marinum]
MTMLMQEMTASHGLTGWMQNITQSFARWRAYRVSVEQLSLRSEHELEDLGMTRADIRDVARRATYGVGD